MNPSSDVSGPRDLDDPDQGPAAATPIPSSDADDLSSSSDSPSSTDENPRRRSAKIRGQSLRDEEGGKKKGEGQLTVNPTILGEARKLRDLYPDSKIQSICRMLRVQPWPQDKCQEFGGLAYALALAECRPFDEIADLLPPSAIAKQRQVSPLKGRPDQQLKGASRAQSARPRALLDVDSRSDVFLGRNEEEEEGFIHSTHSDVFGAFGPGKISEEMIKDAASLARASNRLAWSKLSSDDQYHAICAIRKGRGPTPSGGSLLAGPDGARYEGARSRDHPAAEDQWSRPRSNLLALDSSFPATGTAPAPPQSPRSVHTAAAAAETTLYSCQGSTGGEKPRSLADSLRDRIQERTRAGNSTVLDVAIPKRSAELDDFTRLIATSSTEAARRLLPLHPPQVTQDELCLAGQAQSLRELIMHHVRDVQLADAHLLHIVWGICDLTRLLAAAADSSTPTTEGLMPCLERAHDLLLLGRTAHDRLSERLSEVVLASRTGLWGLPPQPPHFFPDVALKAVSVATSAIKDRGTRFGVKAGPASLATFTQSLTTRAGGGGIRRDQKRGPPGKNSNPKRHQGGGGGGHGFRGKSQGFGSTDNPTHTS